MNRCILLATMIGVCGGAWAAGVNGIGEGDGRGSRDWRDAWRTNRNALLEAYPNLEFDPTSILVRFKTDADGNLRDALRSMVRGSVIRTYDSIPGLEHVMITGRVEDAVATLNTIGRALGVVEYAEPDYTIRATATPNDTHYGVQWGLNNTGQTVNGDPGTSGADIDAEDAWDVTTGSSSVVVAIVDSGVRMSHDDLQGRIWSNPEEIATEDNDDDDGNGLADDFHGWDFVNNDNDPDDDYNHGTRVAGVVGAVGNNSTGISGVAWDCRLAVLKVLNSSGVGTTSNAAAALDYCVYKGIKLSNHSYGFDSGSSTLQTAVTAAKNAGHLMVVAVGNHGRDIDSTPVYPASYTDNNIIAVLATDNDDELASFSGPTCPTIEDCGSNYGETSVDLGAPGKNVYSCLNSSDSSYGYGSGTSLAAPHVTGVAALVWSVNPTWTYSQVRTQILTTVRPVAALNGLCVTEGVVNADDAVD